MATTKSYAKVPEQGLKWVTKEPREVMNAIYADADERSS